MCSLYANGHRNTEILEELLSMIEPVIQRKSTTLHYNLFNRPVTYDKL